MTTTTPRPTVESTEGISVTTESRRPGWFTPLRAILLALLAVVVAVGAWMLFTDDSVSEETALEELVAQERAAMVPYFGDSDPAMYVAMIGDDFTYFDENSGGKLVGEEALEYLRGFEGLVPPFDYELRSTGVQMSGDTAIFTFIMDVIDPESSTVVATWHTTEIHERVGGGWEMVHAHWSNPAPPAE